MSSGFVRAKRAYWNETADQYQQAHGPQLDREPMAWGMWSIPERHVHALPEIAGRRFLELGCGAAGWSVALCGSGAWTVAMDLSERHLSHAAANVEQHDVAVRLVHADGESLPFADESFDCVFCDHGALSWADPRAVVPEVSRVLRESGWLVFNASTPWATICTAEDDGRVTTTLRHPCCSIGHCRAHSTSMEYVDSAWGGGRSSMRSSTARPR